MTNGSLKKKLVAVAVLGLMLSVPAGAAKRTVGGSRGEELEDLGIGSQLVRATGLFWAWLKCGVTVDPNGACKTVMPPAPPPLPSAQTDCGVTVDPNGICNPG